MINQNKDDPASRKARRLRPSPEQALQLSAGRVRDAAALRGLGFSYREIAQHYGVTPQAISLLLSRSRRRMKAIGGNPELAGLSTRASAALQRLGIHGRREAISANVLERLGHSRNCGRKTIEEIENWLGAGQTH